MRRWRDGLLWLWLCACATGCSARFTDERPDGGEADLADGRRDLLLPPAPDLTVVDLVGVDWLGVDFATVPDLAPAPDLAVVAGPIAQGTFMGRAGHGGKGGAELYRRGDGVLELRFGADFQVTGVVGPFVYLTSRGDMGATVDPNADVELGALKMTQGAQSYVVPSGAEVGRRNVFVWCKPFKVEIAKAALVEVK